MKTFDRDNSKITYGVDRCVLYFLEETVPWRGVVSIEETYDTLDHTVVYVDGTKRRVGLQGSDYSSVVQAYMFEDRMLDDNFNMVYRIFTSENQDEYELHLVYNCEAVLNPVASHTLSDDSFAPYFTIDISTVPINNLVWSRPVSHLIIKTRGLWPQAISEIENTLYGTDTEDPYFPTINEVIDVLEKHVWLKITDNGDGTWDAEEMNGAADIIEMVSETEFAIDWSSANYIQEQTYNIHSL